MKKKGVVVGLASLLVIVLAIGLIIKLSKSSKDTKIAYIDVNEQSSNQMGLSRSDTDELNDNNNSYMDNTKDLNSSVTDETTDENSLDTNKSTDENSSDTDSSKQTEDGEADLEETILFSGSQIGSNTILTIPTGSNFDMNNLTSEGYFYAVYKADKLRDVRLVLSVWDKNIWKTILPVKLGELSSGVYFAKYSYDACKKAFGSVDLTEVNSIGITSSAEIELTDLKWYGPEIKGDGSIVLFGGSATAKGSQSLLTYIFTRHVGGDFDASQINEGSYFTMEYNGNKDNIVLALSSVSGATHWVAVSPSSTTTLENGRHLSTFTIEDCIKKFGTNFRRLDQIQIYTQGTEDTTITLRSLKYYPGTGEVIDKNGETKWTNKNKTGIAFIGDSIVQNALSLYGDWKKFLGRDDCSNWGISGQTTVHVEKRIDDMLEGNYDAIVILCGINDLGHGISQNTTIENYRSMFNKIHSKLPDAKVYVISVLPTREPFYVGSQNKIVELNDALKATIEEYDYVTYVDCYSAFVGEDGYCKADYVYDGLHPNENGYGVIAEILKPLLP